MRLNDISADRSKARDFSRLLTTISQISVPPVEPLWFGLVETQQTQKESRTGKSAAGNLSTAG
jgi:hypothetical protein